MKTKWTPGPWTVQPDPSIGWDDKGINAVHPYRLNRHITNGAKFDSFSENHGWVLDRDDGEIICDMRDGEKMIANARLIALAPEMAEALRELVESIESDDALSMAHSLDGHDISECALCKARSLLARLEVQS